MEDVTYYDVAYHSEDTGIAPRGESHMAMFKITNDAQLHDALGVPYSTEVLCDMSLSTNDIKLLATVREIWGYYSLAVRAKYPDTKYITLSVRTIAEHYHKRTNIGMQALRMVAFMLTRLSQCTVMVSPKDKPARTSSLLDADVRRTGDGEPMYYILTADPTPWIG